MSRTHRWIAPCAGVLVVVVALGSFASRSGSESPLTTDGVSPAHSGQLALGEDHKTGLLPPSTVGRNTSPGQGDVPPAVNGAVSFGTAYAQLLAAAAKGDHMAHAALAQGLAYCSQERDLLRHYGDLKSRAERLAKQVPAPQPALDHAVVAIDEAKTRLDVVTSACIGVPHLATTQRWRHQLAAALGGDADSIFDFVTQPAIDPREAFGDDQTVRAYRDHAPKLLEQLIAQGDVRGYQAYVRAGYDALMKRDEYRVHDALSRALKPDPVRVLAYDIALGRSGLGGAFGSGPDYEALRDRQLDPAQRLAAEALAQRIGPEIAAAVSRWLATHPPRPPGG